MGALLREALRTRGGRLPPKVSLAHLPTPLDHLSVSHFPSGAPSVFVKRDDCTGLAFGGNKARKLEFLLADAENKQADIVLTVGAIQSNHVRQTIAAARASGTDVEVFLVDMVDRKSASYRTSGNRFLDEIMGARVHACSTDDASSAIKERLLELEKEERTPYFIPGGGSSPVGSLGYIVAAFELMEQAQNLDVKVDHVIHASSSCGTSAGLAAGFSLMDNPPSLHSILVASNDTSAAAKTIENFAHNSLALLGLDTSPRIRQPTLYTDYFGTAYGQPGAETVRAVRFAAERLGLLLDPVYTGKAFAGLLDLVAKDVFGANETVVFLHTGGVPALFAYEEEFGRR